MLNPKSPLLTANQSSPNQPPSPSKHLTHSRQVKSDHLVSDEQPIRKDESFLVKTSITDQEINSHQIVRDLMGKSHAKVVKQQIPTFSSEIQLYRVAKPKINSGHHRTSPNIDGKLRNEKLNRVYKELQDGTPAWQKIEIAARNHNYLPKNPKKRSFSCKQQNISITGLTTYNFHSVKARYRIAYDPRGTEQEVDNRVGEAKQRSRCFISRTEKIHLKTSPSEAPLDRSLSDAMTHNYGSMPTEQYLHLIQKEKQNNQQIYGERLKSLSRVSQLMQLDEMSQENAELTLNQIKLTCRPTRETFVNAKKRLSTRLKINVDQQFEKRKIPQQQSKVIMRSIQVE